LISTFAPGTTAEVGSVMTPVIVPNVDCPCRRAEEITPATTKKANRLHMFRCFIPGMLLQKIDGVRPEKKGWKSRLRLHQNTDTLFLSGDNSLNKG
jgi:hypothetical protein